MFAAIARKVFGTANDRSIRSLQRRIGAINALEPAVAALSDDALRARTAWLRGRLADGEALDDLLPDAFATVREAARRVLGQRHFDVQLMGGIALHQGRIAEMRTGEGKTLVATLAVYLNALPGEGVHVVTVNDYLARRDSATMGRVYGFLGLTTGCIVPGIDDAQRRAAYACDITYATNNELGFDYLRDNMKFRAEEMVQRPFAYAIVDEVDSILIDEARTPLIISGPADDGSAMYAAIDRVMGHLTPADWEKDEKGRSVTLTEAGAERAEAWLRAAGLLAQGSMYDLHNIGLVHHVNQALRAHTLFQRDKDYIVKDGKVVIIDEFSGRMMDGRRYSEGLHQALEAKEGVQIEAENQTLASITFQNYFRMYPKLAGMTGTALTEAAELGEIYGLDVVEIPTNAPVQRVDHDDEVYRTLGEKDAAIVALVEECRDRRQPVLIGTASIERSERISALLAERGVTHEVLNARHHEREAHIIAQAGRPGAVTVATNMAGRGTDIQLGGNVEMRVADETADLDGAARAAAAERIRAQVAAAREEVRAAGGLYVIGTERNESRRIDNQLRGRSGRQGDPGASKFFLSLEDDLMRVFGSERMGTILEKLGVREGEAIVHPWINKALEKAQTKVEAHNFEIRKNLLKYDDVMNDQRRAVYQQRLDVMTAPDPGETVEAMRREAIAAIVRAAIPENAYPEQWNLTGLHEECRRVLALDLPVHGWAEEEGIAEAEIEARVGAASDAHMDGKRQRYGDEMLRTAQRMVLLQMLDAAWKDHLLSLDHLRQGINLRAYAQKDPLLEYKREAYAMFEAMLDSLRESVTSVLSHLDITAAPASGAAPAGLAPLAAPGDGDIPRNAPCPCGSGQRYKHCHGRL